MTEVWIFIQNYSNEAYLILSFFFSGYVALVILRSTRRRNPNHGVIPEGTHDLKVKAVAEAARALVDTCRYCGRSIPWDNTQTACLGCGAPLTVLPPRQKPITLPPPGPPNPLPGTGAMPRQWKSDQELYRNFRCVEWEEMRGDGVTIARHCLRYEPIKRNPDDLDGDLKYASQQLSEMMVKYGMMTKNEARVRDAIISMQMGDLRRSVTSHRVVDTFAARQGYVRSLTTGKWIPANEGLTRRVKR